MGQEVGRLQAGVKKQLLCASLFLGHVSHFLFIWNRQKQAAAVEKGMDLAAALGAMMKNNIQHWEVSQGERQSHAPSLFGELQPRTDFVESSLQQRCGLCWGRARVGKRSNKCWGIWAWCGQLPATYAVLWGGFISTKIRVNRLLLALVPFISLFILLGHFSGSAKKAFRDGWVISNYDKSFQQSSNVPNE